MKLLLLCLSLLTSTAAFASGTTIGNGGNGIVCQNSVELLDYYELRLNGGTLQLDPSLGAYANILNALFTKWQAVAPVRMAQYKQWLSEFPSVAGIYPGVQIPAIPDTGTIVIPDGCVLSPLAFQRPDSEVLPGVKRYTINKDLWDLMPEVQKAGLVLHELIYREGIKAGQATSFATRYFNGYLASAVPKSETYAGFVSQLPLPWVEYGGGLVLQLGTLGYYSGGSANVDGTVEAYLSGAVGNINTDLIKIEFNTLPQLGPNSQEKLTVTDTSFKPSPSCFDVKKLIFSPTNAYLDFQEPFGTLCEIDTNEAIGIDDGLQDGPVALNPSTSWFKQSDGSIISGITSVDKDARGFLGSVLKTSSGQTWSWDSQKGMYKSAAAILLK